MKSSVRAIDFICGQIDARRAAPRWITSYRGLEVVELGRSLHRCGFQEGMVEV